MTRISGIVRVVVHVISRWIASRDYWVGCRAGIGRKRFIQLLADRAFQWSLNAPGVVISGGGRDSSRGGHRFIDHLVGDRIHRRVDGIYRQVRPQPDHELRRSTLPPASCSISLTTFAIGHYARADARSRMAH